MELSRRKWSTLELGPLQTWRKRDIVEAFLKRSLAGRITGEPSSLMAAEYHQGAGKTQRQGSPTTFLTGLEAMNDGAIGLATDTAASGLSADVGDDSRQRGSAPGFVLFPSMIESILSK